MTQSGSARGSYLETMSQLFSNYEFSVQTTSQNLLQTFPKSFPNPPKSIQKASWGPSWTNPLTKLDFEGPKNAQEAPKSGQERPQTVPNPSQMEAKTLPKPIFERFFGFRSGFWSCCSCAKTYEKPWVLSDCSVLLEKNRGF